MPSKNAIKAYLSGGVYHIYNRGINKSDIFLDDKDYKMFLTFLKQALTESEDKDTARTVLVEQGMVETRCMNFAGNIELLSFCLMPNHFHFLVKQKDTMDITSFMRSLITSYTIYFNKRHDRTGTLFQGRYKAVLVTSDAYIMHLSRYIHLNPVAGAREILQGPSLQAQLIDNAYSSYVYFLGKKKAEWVRPEFILNYFGNDLEVSMNKIASYEKFVEEYLVDIKEALGELAID